MSTKFVTVKQAPTELPKDTMVIKMPDFLQEIELNKNREPRGTVTAATHLRYIVGSIGEKYDPELGAYTVRPHLFEGRAYNNDKELSAIVVEMLRSQYPKVFDKYLEQQIRARPQNIKLIYYVGDFASTGPFFANGLDSISEKDVDVFLGLKEKKVVGKPMPKNKTTLEEETNHDENQGN